MVKARSCLARLEVSVFVGDSVFQFIRVTTLLPNPQPERHSKRYIHTATVIQTILVNTLVPFGWNIAGYGLVC